MSQGSYCSNCTMYIATIHELRNQLTATKQKLEAAEKTASLRARVAAAWKQRAEAAESRIKASQDQEPFMLMESSTIIKEDKAYGMQKVLSYGDKIYLQPIITPTEAELQARIAELEKQIKEGK